MSNLYIVATPIGNLQDTTVRAATTLLTTSVIVAESTSKAGILLDFIEKQFGRKRSENQKIISLTEDEEESKIPSLVKLLEESDAALISEAGTPLVSDPGFKLVREAIRHGVNIVPIPGATAVISALSASGLPTDKFFFIGFLPKNNSKKEKLITQIKTLGFKTTIVAYESPTRTRETLLLIKTFLGDIDVVVAREITKIHEEFLRGKISEVIAKIGDKDVRGEVTIVFSNS